MLQNTQLAGFCGYLNFAGQYFRDTFDDYPLGERVMYLNSNNGFFSGTGWSIKASHLGMQGREKFQDYTIGSIDASQLDAGGIGWGDDTWTLNQSYFGLQGRDKFDDGISTGGTGFTTDWNIESSYFGMQGRDGFESYIEPTEMAEGTGFINIWEVR